MLQKIKTFTKNKISYNTLINFDFKNYMIDVNIAKTNTLKN